VTPFAMIALQERMSFFVQPTEEVYEGMVIGENSRADDMDVNITKEKKLTNMRSSTSDSFESMTPPRVLTLEESLEFARDDECVEVTPEKVRIRKVVLDATERGRAAAREAPGRERLTRRGESRPGSRIFSIALPRATSSTSLSR
jgi:GTP-binding protein